MSYRFYLFSYILLQSKCSPDQVQYQQKLNFKELELSWSWFEGLKSRLKMIEAFFKWIISHKNVPKVVIVLYNQSCNNFLNAVTFDRRVFVLFQLSPPPRTSRSDLTRCTFTPTRRRPSAMTAGRCCGGSSDRASNVKVRLWQGGSCKVSQGFSPTGLFKVASCCDDSVVLWFAAAVTSC